MAKKSKHKAEAIHNKFNRDFKVSTSKKSLKKNEIGCRTCPCLKKGDYARV